MIYASFNQTCQRVRCWMKLLDEPSIFNQNKTRSLPCQFRNIEVHFSEVEYFCQLLLNLRYLRQHYRMRKKFSKSSCSPSINALLWSPSILVVRFKVFKPETYLHKCRMRQSSSLRHEFRNHKDPLPHLLPFLTFDLFHLGWNISFLCTFPNYLHFQLQEVNRKP